MSNEPTEESHEMAPTKRTSAFFKREVNEGDQPASNEPAPKKTKSALQRLGIDPIFTAPDGEADRPPRSPTGAVRSISGVKFRMKPVAPPSSEPTAAPAEGTAAVEVDGTPWHQFTEEELFKQLEVTTGMAGLTSAEAEARLAKYGKNVITPPPQTHWLIKLLLLLVGGFQLMMIGGGILCFIVYGISGGKDVQSLALGIVLIVVVLVSALFQHFQEGKADKIMESLRQLTAESVYTWRDGVLQQIPADLLVPGDVVKVNSGEKVPADLRIMTATDLKVNNAPLTGENVDIKLGPNANHITLYEAKNVARSGCNFTCGNGVGVVFLTGDNTFFGLIAKSTTSVEHPDTLMKRQIRRLIFILGAFAIALGVLFLILSLLSGYTWIESVLFLISIIVANVPEGLLPQLTVALSITAKRLQHRGVLVSNLEIIETLGAVTVICSDKTGTLTCNRMTATHVVYNAQIHLANEDSPKQAGDDFQVFDPTNPSFKLLHQCLALNTDAVFLQNAEQEPDVLKRLVKGDASETAMVKFIEPLRPIAEHRAACKRLVSIPFNSSNKWMLSINEQEGDQKDSLPLWLFIKGAPERVLGMCSGIAIDGQTVPLDEEMQSRMNGINMTLGKRGERVIAMAYAELDRGMFPPGFEFETDPPNFPMGGLTLLGFTALIDPPRPTVFHAVEECHSAGVKVIMVTGDHPITARSIAKSLNMITQKTKEEMEEDGETVPPNYHGAIVIHGQDMSKFDQADWDFVLSHEEIVFARTMPQQKQELVQQLARKNHIVAMTGDGVNDAPALKAAHVGIAMYSGAAVAKEAAQLVLLEDDFSAIVEGIREGRLIFDNLKKCIAYVLSSNVPELVPFLAYIAGKIPLAIETIIILTIDVGTDLLPAVSLAFEDPEDSIMKRPPRARDAHLVGFRMFCICYFIVGVIETGAAFHGFIAALDDYGFPASSLQGIGLGFRKDYTDLDAGEKVEFAALCLSNVRYQTERAGNDCFQDFSNYRWEALGAAQAAFLAAVVWGQVANILVRKTMLATLFTFKRAFGNRVMLWSFLSEFAVLFALLYIPGLNTVFMLHPPNAEQIFRTLWVIPAIIIVEEVRKFFCRLNPDGWFAIYSSI
jgi:sodium/potassium-transporting ATPase subunit alpha